MLKKAEREGLEHINTLRKKTNEHNTDIYLQRKIRKEVTGGKRLLSKLSSHRQRNLSLLNSMEIL